MKALAISVFFIFQFLNFSKAHAQVSTPLGGSISTPTLPYQLQIHCIGRCGETGRITTVKVIGTQVLPVTTGETTLRGIATELLTEIESFKKDRGKKKMSGIIHHLLNDQAVTKNIELTPIWFEYIEKALTQKVSYAFSFGVGAYTIVKQQDKVVAQPLDYRLESIVLISNPKVSDIQTITPLSFQYSPDEMFITSLQIELRTLYSRMVLTLDEEKMIRVVLAEHTPRLLINDQILIDLKGWLKQIHSFRLLIDSKERKFLELVGTSGDNKVYTSYFASYADSKSAIGINFLTLPIRTFVSEDGKLKSVQGDSRFIPPVPKEELADFIF